MVVSGRSLHAQNAEKSACVDCFDPCQTPCGSDVLSISHCSSSFCDSEISARPRGVRAVGFGFHQKYPAPEILAMDFSSSRTSITVNVTMMEHGLAYCTALRALASFGSKLSYGRQAHGKIVKKNFGAESDVNGTATVVIDGLHPLTEYNVYCTSVNIISNAALPESLLDMNGNKLSDGMGILETLAPFTTACCRSIEVDLASAPWHIVGDYRKDALMVSIPFIPDNEKDQFNLTFTATDLGGVLAANPFDPPGITLNTAETVSSSFRQLIALLPSSYLLRGHYTISAALDGPQGAKYQIENMRPNILQVLDDTDAVPSPEVTSVVFSSDFTSVNVFFDGPTNMANMTDIRFTCSDVLSFIDAESVSTTVRCKWVSSSIISITGSQLVVGDNVTVLPDTMRPLCKKGREPHLCRVNQVALTALVDMPDNSIQPIIKLSALTHLPLCEGAKIDLGNSRGGGGRPFSSITFHVTATDSESASKIRAYAQANFDITSSYLFVPSTIQSSESSGQSMSTARCTTNCQELLKPGISYSFSATPCNFAGCVW